MKALNQFYATGPNIADDEIGIEILARLDSVVSGRFADHLPSPVPLKKCFDS